jgi:hypothetical protein
MAKYKDAEYISGIALFNRIGGAGRLYDFKNKEKSNMLYLMQNFNKTINMFKWSGLDDVKTPFNELFQQVNGYACLIKCGDTYYITPCTFADGCDPYYFPRKVIVLNPWANDIEGFNGVKEINKDCVILKNDTMMLGLSPLINRYTTMLVENDISLLNCSILARIVALLSVAGDKQKAEADKYIKAIIKGDFGVFASKNVFDDVALQAQPISNTSSSIMQELIEFEQYLKGSLAHELGINYSFNMKRESLNTAESELNDDYLIPLIDDMLECRKQFCRDALDVFGIEIDVELASVWRNNKLENEAEAELNSDVVEEDVTTEDIESSEAQSEEAEADATEQEDEQDEEPEE